VACGCVLLPLGWFASRSLERLGPLVSWAGEAPPDRVLPAVIVTVTLVLTLAYAGRELVVERGSLPRAIYLVSVGIQPVFALVAGAIYSFTLISVTHWMIALALSARIISNQRVAAGASPWPSLRRLAASHAALIGFLVVLSIVLHALLIRPTAAPSSIDYAIHFGFRLGERPIALAVLSGAYFGITFVHFLYDRYVYSFHRPEVRTAIAPHLFAPQTSAR
jgi:hypothetical protein